MSANSPKIGEIRKGKEINRSGSDNHKYIWHRCEGCGKARWVQLMNIKSIPIPNKKLCIACGVREAWKRPEVIIKQSESRKGEKCYCWKGGLARSRHRGYVFIKLRPDSSFYSMANQDKKISGAYVAQHRLVMARYLGRCLKPDEIVHHKNSIRDDNRIENLELTKPGAHTIEHGKGLI